MKNHYIYGETLEGEISLKDIQTIFHRSSQLKTELYNYPVRGTINLLKKTAFLLKDSENTILSRLQASFTIAPEMLKQGFDSLLEILTGDYLEKKVINELGSLDIFEFPHKINELYLKASPLGVMFHLSSSNVFITPVLSLIEGLLTKNINLIKMTSGNTYFPLLFADYLLKADPDKIVAKSFCFLDISSKEEEKIDKIIENADRVIVWGGESAVMEVRKKLPHRSKTIEYGPRLSFAVLTKRALQNKNLKEIANNLAKDISSWDQQSCSSPQNLFIENLDKESSYFSDFISYLTESMERYILELPPQEKSSQELARSRELKEIAEFRAAQGEGSIYSSKVDGNWTIYLSSDEGFEYSPLNRTLLIKNYKNFNDLKNIVKSVEPYIQTIGVECEEEEFSTYSSELIEAGALRITDFDKMGGGLPGEPHDGIISMRELVKWNQLDSVKLKDHFDFFDSMNPNKQKGVVNAKLQHLHQFVQNSSPFYQNWAKNKSGINEYDFIDRNTIGPFLPPDGSGLLNDRIEGGYWLRSGGSTGEPKVSIFSMDDFIQDMKIGARGVFNAGLRKTDRVINLFTAGSLYGSFLSTLRITEEIGCDIFPVSSSASFDEIVYIIKKFNINTLFGLPSFLTNLLSVKKEDFKGVRIEKMYYGGEHLDNAFKIFVKELLSTRIIASIGYGTVDCGPIGYQCLHLEGSVHHLHSDHQHLEIINQHGVPSNGCEPGNIIVTNLNRKKMPIIRYRIGDRGRWVEGKCSCGSAFPMFELLGRSDLIIVAAGINILFNDILNIVKRFDSLNSNIQIHVEKKDFKDVITVKAEFIKDIPNQGEIEKQILVDMLNEIPVLEKALTSGNLKHLRVKIENPGVLKRNERTGKIIPIHDKRVAD